jgi:hypothetical protein
VFKLRKENTEQNHSIMSCNKSFESVAIFKYLETTLTKENRVHEEITSRLKAGDTG